MTNPADMRTETGIQFQNTDGTWGPFHPATTRSQANEIIRRHNQVNHPPRPHRDAFRYVSTPQARTHE